MNRKKLIKLAAVALVPVGAAIAGTTFHWRGGGESGSVANVDNWQSGEPERGYPGDVAADDTVVIDDRSQREAVVIDNGTLTVAELRVGDDHEIVLDDDIEIVGDQEHAGRLRLEGDVTISGSGRIVTDGIYVNSTQKTVITVGEGVVVQTPEPEQEE